MEPVTTKALCSQWERCEPPKSLVLVESTFPLEGLKTLPVREPAVTVFLSWVLRVNAYS